MFGFSILKILFTLAVIIIVWQGFKWLNQRKRVVQERAEKLAKQLIHSHEEPPMEEDIRTELDEYLDRRVAEGGVPTDY